LTVVFALLLINGRFISVLNFLCVRRW